MPWTIPDKGEGAADIQSVLFQEYLDVLAAGIAGTQCVVHGCAVTAQGSPDMTVAVAKGSVISNSVLYAVAGANATITTADGTNPRLDLVVVNSSGALAVRAGTAATNPKPPARTAGDVVLAVVLVPASDTTIATDQITDLRIIRQQGPLVLKAATTAVTFNTTTAIQTYASLTIPNGLLLAGRAIRFRAGGNYLSNSGTGTWTLTISFGGTTLFADASGATTADADRGAWRVEGEIIGEGTSSQRLNGRVTFQTPGAKTNATTGIGDLGATTHINTPMRGTSAVNADAANNDLLIRWTMSVSNAAVETVCDFSTFELI